jgi:hypothetical protein
MRPLSELGQPSGYPPVIRTKLRGRGTGVAAVIAHLSLRYAVNLQ